MSRQPMPPSELAGRWLTRFFTSYLAGERAASPRTIVAYRDAIKLLLIWFKDIERIPPEKLRLADIDRPRVLRFLDWLETERNCGAATRNQRLAVIKSFCRYTAVEQPDNLDQVTQILAIRQKNTSGPQLGYLTADEVKALLAQPGTASTRAVRDTVLLAVAYDTAARVQELGDRNSRHPGRQPDHSHDPREGIQNPVRAAHGADRPTRPRLPGTCRPALSLDADTSPLFHGPHHSRLPGPGSPSSWSATCEPSERATRAGLPACRSHPTRSDAPGRCT